MRETSNELFTYRDPLYSFEVKAPNHLVADQELVFDLMVDTWLAENNPSALTGQINDSESTYHDVVFFKSLAEREAFETWYSSLKASEILLGILSEFDVETLLDQEETLNIAGKIPHWFSIDYRYKPEEFIAAYHDISVWLMKHAKREKGHRIWFDFTRDCFFFEDSRIAVNFKLKFTVEEQKEELKPIKPKRVVYKNNYGVMPTYDEIEDYKNYNRLKEYGSVNDSSSVEAILDIIRKKKC